LLVFNLINLWTQKWEQLMIDHITKIEFGFLKPDLKDTKGFERTEY